MSRVFKLCASVAVALTVTTAAMAQWSIGQPGTREPPQGLNRYVYLVMSDPLPGREFEQIAEDNPDLSSVASLADRLGLSQRSVQEICHRGLGIHPKWLIRCFRLQDAALRLEAEANVSLSGLAQALGYFDQAHFTRDFKRATGVNPGHYRLCIGAGAEAPA